MTHTDSPNWPVRQPPKVGSYVVANYDSIQDPEQAYRVTPYCWAVQTTYHGPTDTKGSRITADLSNRPGRKRHTHAYDYSLDGSPNHVEAAFEFMRRHVLESGKDAQLACMASTERGFLFVFI